MVRLLSEAATKSGEQGKTRFVNVMGRITEVYPGASRRQGKPLAGTPITRSRKAFSPGRGEEFRNVSSTSRVRFCTGLTGTRPEAELEARGQAPGDAAHFCHSLPLFVSAKSARSAFGPHLVRERKDSGTVRKTKKQPRHGRPEPEMSSGGK
jgi:hypothetical protein